MSTNSPKLESSQASPEKVKLESNRRSSIQVAGRKEINDFLVGKLLGEGAFARVFIVRAKDTGKDYAMKVMEKKFIVKEGKSKEVQMERKVLSDVSHPNVVRLFFSFHDKDRLYMILDLCPGGELAKIIRVARESNSQNIALSEDDTRFYLSETISAVQHLHSLGILHRDLKPENVLISANGHVKITDFGTAKDLKQKKEGEHRKDTFCGTAEYVSPEVLQDGEAGIGADLWALGIMTHSMLIGKTPFLRESEFLTFQCILSYAGVKQPGDFLNEEDQVQLNSLTPETFTFPQSERKLSQATLDFVKELLKPIPSDRLGNSQPDSLRKHPFFKGLDFSKLDQILPPKLPFSMAYEAPHLDGAKQEWLMTDDDTELDDIETEDPPKKNNSRTSRDASSNHSNIGVGLDKYLNPGESILLDGAVSVISFVGLVNSRRHLVLTNKGRAIFVDPSSLLVKDELLVSGSTIVLIRSNGKEFEFQTPKRTIKMKDLLGSAERWKDAIAKL